MQIVFLPGAGGQRTFWAPVARRLGLSPKPLLLGWPGFGDEPAIDAISSLTDLPRFVLERYEGQADIVAQSMGGVVAMLIALKTPARVRSLVLCATSGGADFSGIPREDWRPSYLDEMPVSTPRWFVDDRSDLTAELGRITMPVLLLWGGSDPIVPPAAGVMLVENLPNARLVVVPDAEHDVALTHPDEVAGHLAAFLSELDEVMERPV